jgi:hypothetical protein
MAGAPKRRADKALLNSLTTGDCDDILDRIGNAESLRAVAEHYNVSRRALTEWLEDDDDRSSRYKRARVQAAGMLAEESINIADGIDDPNRHDYKAGEDGKCAICGLGGIATTHIGDSARDKLRLGARQWLASRWDRETYGEQKQPTVQINLATLHLDALRRRPTVTTTDVKCLPEPDNTKG